ncbi:hypothetical protein BMS3Bbin03_01473 [bacterium BMS3Bbin03]|nr:hypothetical protein BMS3Bbin03_01473 [bacterium BMS3Bbin03]
MNREAAAPKKKKMTNKEYSNLLKNIEINSIVLLELEAKRYPASIEKDMGFHIKHEPEFVKANCNDFDIIDLYTITARSGRKNIFKIRIKWLLSFSSEVEVNEEFFAVYAERSLILNTYPYVREIVQSITSKMDVPPLVMPLYKAK